MTKRMTVRVIELIADRVPFVHATVVRAQVPTSAKAGDDAIVLQDGTIEGFVGGTCAETSVRTAALGALRDGNAVLLRVLPEGDVEFPQTPGAQVVVNHCLSGGALEIFLEPMLPAPLVEVVGQTPVADAIVAIAEVLGYATSRPEPGVDADAGRGNNLAAAVIVASHGRDEERSLRTALDAGVGYIALVASRRRGAGVLDELGLTAEQRERIHTPAGLDIGARTAPEVALSILAEVITSVRTRGEVAPGSFEALASNGSATAALGGAGAPLQVVDPVCGMTVTVMPDTPSLVVDGETFYFCSQHCRDRYADAQPER